MQRPSQHSRQFPLRSLGTLVLCLVLVACDDVRAPPVCHDYFASDDTAGYQMQGSGAALHLASDVLWYRCAAGQRFSEGQCLGESLLMSWDDANSFAAEFSQNSAYQWRLPSNAEFSAITSGQCLNPALNPNVFPQMPVDNYWTADSHMITSSRKCMIYTFQGQITCREPGVVEHPFMLVTKRR